MMKEIQQKLTLDQPATYQIKVPGHLDENWSDWAGGMTITVENGDDGPPTTTLTRRRRRPGCFAGPAASTLFPGLAAGFGQLG